MAARKWLHGRSGFHILRDMAYSGMPSGHAMQRVARYLYEGEQPQEAAPAKWLGISGSTGWLVVTPWRAFWLDDRPVFLIQMTFAKVTEVKATPVTSQVHIVHSGHKQRFACERGQAQLFAAAIRRNLHNAPPLLPAFRVAQGPTSGLPACGNCGEWQWPPEGGICPACLAPFDVTDEATQKYLAEKGKP